MLVSSIILKQSRPMVTSNWTGPTGLDTSFEEMMPDTVQFFAETAVNKYGKPTYSATSTSIKGRIIFEQRKVTNEFGEDVVTAGRVYLYGNNQARQLNEKIQLPSGKTPIVVAIENKTDTAGYHHTVVHFGA